MNTTFKYHALNKQLPLVLFLIFYHHFFYILHLVLLPIAKIILSNAHEIPTSFFTVNNKFPWLIGRRTVVVIRSRVIEGPPNEMFRRRPFWQWFIRSLRPHLFGRERCSVWRLRTRGFVWRLRARGLHRTCNLFISSLCFTPALLKTQYIYQYTTWKTIKQANKTYAFFLFLGRLFVASLPLLDAPFWPLFDGAIFFRHTCHHGHELCVTTLAQRISRGCG